MTAPNSRGGQASSGTGNAGVGLALTGRCRLGSLSVDVDVAVAAGTTLAVVGPNGAGKTTLLRIIAGLVGLDAGRLQFDGESWDDPDTGSWVAPEQRSVGFVFQDRLLFEHLSVLDNVAFGLRARGAGRGSAHESARDWLSRVGLADRGDVKPAELSGGQAQRVALARALATEPRVVLLDEPLSALDAQVHRDMVDLLDARAERPRGVRLLVTHDPADAMTLADAVLVLEEGRVTQFARPDVLEPTGYLARFLG